MLKSILKEICVKNKHAYVTNKFSMKIGYENRVLDFFPCRNHRNIPVIMSD